MRRHRHGGTVSPMTETTTAAPPPGDRSPDDQTQPDAGDTHRPAEPAPPTGPPLVRPRHGRVLKGVCAAVGHATRTDPVLWRVVLVVLAFFGGTGIVLYLAGWLLIPAEGSTGSHVQRLVRGQRVSTPAAIALVVLGVVAVLAITDDGRGLVPLAVLGVLAYLVLRARQDAAAPTWAGTTAPGEQSATSPAGWSAPAWTAPEPGAAGGPPGWGPPPTAPSYGPPPPPVPPAPTSNLGLLTVSALGVVVGALLLAGALGVDGITASGVLAAALLVTGAGLLVGARWGRARGLIALAVVLALALGATSSFDHRFGGSAGERTWIVDASTERELGAGSAVLDLTPLAGARRTVDVEARVGVGELVVLVPEGLRVDLDAEVGLGELRMSGRDGVVRTESGGGLDRTAELGPAGRRTVQLDVRVGLGTLEVRHVEAR